MGRGMRQFMKKIITILMSILTLMLVAFSGVGCSIEWQFESDGKFKYYYISSKDGYRIVGTEETGFSDPMYVPAYYKGKLIYNIMHQETGYMGGQVTWAIDYGSAKKIYYPFSIAFMIDFVSTREIYITSTQSVVSYSMLGAYDQRDVESGIELEEIYLTSKRYNELKQEVVNKNDINLKYLGKKFLEYNIFEGYLEIRLYGTEVNFAIVKVANTSYIFNYEGAPNNGYFFINNFEDGALIENTPYVPLREGYTFAGWYKEEACINKCDFDIDVYEEQYDENGQLIFNELKLYAKWVEK